VPELIAGTFKPPQPVVLFTLLQARTPLFGAPVDRFVIAPE